MTEIDKLQMFGVVDHFLGYVINHSLGNKGRFTPLDLVKRAGRIFTDSNGRDGAALYFLKSFITSDIAKAIANPKNFLAIAVREAESPEEKLRQAVEIMEYAYAFLDFHLDKLRLETKWVMVAIMNFPPDSGFFDRVAEKTEAIKAENGRAVA